MSASYKQMSRPVGFEIAFSLEGSKLVVDSLRKIDTVDLRSVEEVRLSFQPQSFASRVFKTRLRLSNGKSVTFSSITWRGMFQTVDQGPQYRAFLLALIEAIHKANPDAVFRTGKPYPLWLLTCLVTGATMLGIAALTWRAFELKAWPAMLLGLGVGALGVWQLEPFARLNRPGTFRPDAPPADLIP